MNMQEAVDKILSQLILIRDELLQISDPSEYDKYHYMALRINQIITELFVSDDKV